MLENLLKFFRKSDDFTRKCESEKKEGECSFKLTRSHSHSHSFFVPGVGLEPTQYCYHWCLRPARLPVPPSGQSPLPSNQGLRKYIKYLNFCPFTFIFCLYIPHPCRLAPRGICPPGKFLSLGPLQRGNL